MKIWAKFVVEAGREQWEVLDTCGNWQLDKSSHMVYLNMHKIPNLWKFELNLLSKLGDNNGR